MTRYAEVAVHLPVPGLYSYEVPHRLSGAPLVGGRVLVPFGNRGVAGIVVRVHDQSPSGVDKVRELEALLDETPTLSEELLGLCMWIADYYEAPPGEVMRAALPAGTSIGGSQWVSLTDAGERALAGEGGALSRRRRELLAALSASGGTATQKHLLSSSRARRADLGELVETGLVRYEINAGVDRVKPRTVRVAVLERDLTEVDRASMHRAKKRLEVLEAIVAAGGEASVASLKAEVPTAASHVRALAEANLVRIEHREEAARPSHVGDAVGGSGTTPPELTATQRDALAAIGAGLESNEFHSYLVYGITGSGKTEVYLGAIDRIMRASGGAIVLVPEISLTPQLAARFRARFGDQVAVLHSGLSNRARYDEWQRLKGGHARIALGARSAIFAPVADLRIVVVDEEHDSSFKQEEGVRYNARDVALVRAKRAGGVCVLGSATPSLESFHGAGEGRHELLRLPERPTPSPLPDVELVDLRKFQAEGEAMLTAPLAEAIEQTLAAGDQVIVFLNRRGFSTFVLCRACGHAFRCKQCSVSLTYHRSRDRLMCHYCGHAEAVPVDCPECAAAESIVRRGLGTEKVADALAEKFPAARVARLDRDVAAGANAEKVLAKVARREVDILVGTQMVTKGHDFPGVTLVGVLCADTGLSLPDFRASERTFQLLTQVAGRAGRGDRPGRVIIQSYRTETIAVSAASEQDYEGFYEAELAARSELGYPPSGHLIAIRLDGPDAHGVEQAARVLAARARDMMSRHDIDVSILGPSEAPLARLKGRTRWQLWLRAPSRKTLRQVVRAAAADDPHIPTGVRISVDVDPISAL